MKVKTQPDLSIIIISYNTKRITIDCLTSIITSLQGSMLKVEIIIIDNASSDGSVEAIKAFGEHHPEVVLKSYNENLGFGKANNIGVKLAKASTVLLLNSDTIAIENAVERLHKYFSANYPKYAFIGGKLLNQDMSPQPSVGKFFTLPVIFMHLFLQGDKLGLTRRSPNENTPADWISGACIICQKEDFLQLNGFDEGIFMYMEEVDLLYRASLVGMHTGYTPTSKFIHIGSASSKKSYPIIQTFRGFLYLYSKFYSLYSYLTLKSMLQLKALIGIIIGKILNNSYLLQAYGEAFKITKMDRYKSA